MLVPCVVLMIASSAAGTMMVHALERVLDGLLITGLSWEGARIIAYLFAAGAASALAHAGYALVLPYLMHRLTTDLRDNLFAHLMRLDYGFFLGENPGRLLSYMVNDTAQINTLFRESVLGLGRHLTMIAFLAAFMIWKDWLLALLVLIVLPVLFLLARRFGRRMRRASAALQAEQAEFLRRLEEVVTGIREVMAATEERGETERMRARLKDLRHAGFRIDRLSALWSPVFELLLLAALCAVFLYGAWRVQIGAATAGEITAFFIALLAANQPLKQLTRSWGAVQTGLAALQRVYGLFLVSPAVRERPAAPPLPRAPLGRGGAEIVFEKVSFSYSGDDRFALHDFSCRILPGETAAFVGASGAGKTTLFNLLLRFWDPSAGALRINGAEVRDVSLASLRGAMALVSQESDFLDETVRGNLAYGLNRPPEDAELWAALRDARLADFVADLEGGLDAAVGAGGARLSGGQRQRLALARALLQKAPVLLLDEATSSLDAESEARIQETLAARRGGQTVLIIAHRFSTVRDADRIFVMEGGRILEEGPPAELLAKGGRYARLMRLQTQFGAAGRVLGQAGAALGGGALESEEGDGVRERRGGGAAREGEGAQGPASGEGGSNTP